MASAVWLAASSAAQTVNIHYRFTDFQTNLANVSQVSITPIPTNGAYNALLSQYFPKFTRGNTPSLTNGEMTLSNVLKGRIYRTTFTARGGDQTYDILVGTNLPDGATIDAWTNIVTGANDTVDGFAGYSQAAANAKFLEKSNGTASALSLGTDLNAGGHSLTNVTDVTDANGNSLLGTGSGSGEANVGANIGTGVGIYAGKSGLSLNLRSVAASGGATVFTNATTLTISADAAGASAAATNGYPWGALYDPINSALAVQAALAATNAAIQAQLQLSNTVYRAALASKLDAINGTATNLNIGGDGISFTIPDQAPLVVRMTNANVNAMSISVLSSTNEQTAAGLHVSTFSAGSLTDGQSFDLGLWSHGFGAGYADTAAIDLYNRNADHSSATSNQPPNFGVSVTDSREGSVLRHPIFGVDSTNLWFEMFYQTNGSREKIPGFIWDRTIGVMPFHNAAKNNQTPSGTVTGSGTAITGTGTIFGSGPFGELGFGDAIAVGVKNYLVKTAPSSTNATVLGPGISPTFTGSNYNIFRAPIRWFDVNGNPASAIGPDGVPIVHRAADGAWMRFLGATKDYQINEGASGEFLIYNVSDNTIPLSLTSDGALTVTSLSGSLNASQLTSGSVSLARESTNIIVYTNLPTAGQAVVVVGTNASGQIVLKGTNVWSGGTGGSGDMVAANNLSDVANAATALANIGGLRTNQGTAFVPNISTNSASANLALTIDNDWQVYHDSYDPGDGPKDALTISNNNIGFGSIFHIDPEVVMENGLIVKSFLQSQGLILAEKGISSSASVVTNGITNLSLTASTLLKADANKKLSSIANGAGVLTNDASGNFGYAPLLDASALKASQYVATDANTNLVSTQNGINWTNTEHYTNFGTTTNIVLPSDGLKWTGTITNGPVNFISFAGNAMGPWTLRVKTNAQFVMPPQVVVIGYSNNFSTNGLIDLQPYGGTNDVIEAIGELGM